MQQGKLWAESVVLHCFVREILFCHYFAMTLCSLVLHFYGVLTLNTRPMLRSCVPMCIALLTQNI